MVTEELKQAVLEGDLNKVDQALSSNKLYNLNQADHNGCTLLMHAVLKGRLFLFLLNCYSLHRCALHHKAFAFGSLGNENV